MKKKRCFVLNLKFMRVPLILCIFFSLIALIVTLSVKAPRITLGNNITGAFLSQNAAIISPSPYYAIFPFIKTTAAKKETKTANSTPEPVSVPMPAKNAVFSEVKVSNSTQEELDITNYLNALPAFINKDISILIVHTHTTESYTPSPKYNYTPSDTDRTLDKNYNMVRIGKEVAEILRQNGISVYHDTTINDYPSYNGSYNRSSLCVENNIANDSSVKIVLDIHRDAIEGKNGEKVKYTFDANGEKAASVMIVAGSNLSGLNHPDWEQNLNFAATLHSHAEAMYPGMMRPLNFRSQRFNQHLAPGAIIVEVGTNGNTLDEALLGARCFANALSDYLNQATQNQTQKNGL